MKLWLIRHGETDYNRKGIVQGGGIDSDLNETGRLQARAFFLKYASQSFDAVYVSPLKRTHQTLAPWQEEQDYDFRIAPELIEFGWGHHEGKQPTPADTAEFHALKAQWAAGNFDAGIDGGGDTPNIAWARLKPFFEQLYQRHQGQTILVCSHGRTIRIILSQLLKGSMHFMNDFSSQNTGLHLLEFEDAGVANPLSINDLSHLNAEDDVII